MPFIQALRDWQNFYLLTGTAAATLIGLMLGALDSLGKLALAVVLLLVVGIRNAWDLTLWIARRRQE
jgi:hypothetical protein